MAKAFAKEASKYCTDSVPNFMQCAGGLRDGTTKCAQLLRAFDSEPVDCDLQAIVEMGPNPQVTSSGLRSETP